MELYWLIVFFLVGITFGSFFNVVGLRVPTKRPFMNDRSYCPHCHHKLAWLELIPVLSYLLQRGKCRHCKKRISPLYPVMEGATGLLFAYGYWTLGFTPELFTAILFISMLCIVLVADITSMLIPDRVLLFFLPLLVIGRILSPLSPWYDAIIGAAVGGLIIALIIIVTNGGMGAGDMKLFFLIGLVLGWKTTLLTLFLAAFIGTVVGGLFMLMKKMNKKQPIPFGPSIACAAILTYFQGEHILSMYLSLFQ